MRRLRVAPLAAEEGAPLSSPCLREFIGQANRNIGRKNRSASFEGSLDGLDKGGLKGSLKGTKK